jgi:hydroxyacylglutathione hydrolase
MFFRMIYDDKLAQAAYLIGCQRTGEAIVIDPERDVDRYLEIARQEGLRITAVAETHIHADFLSGARELAERVGAKVYVSDEGDADWKYLWLDAKSGGGGYDHRLLRDGDRFGIGNIDFHVMHTPGHTPEHVSFLVTDRGGGADEPMGIVTGDFLFVGDLGRPDLLETAAGQAGAKEPSARRLFQSVKRLDGLPEFLQVWPAHGAGSACGKALGAVPSSTIGYERRFNSALQAAGDEDGFVDFILSGQPEPPLYFARMKHDNKHGPAVLGELPYPPRLTAEEIASLDAGSGVVVDTRPWVAFRAGHVPGALWLPLSGSFPTDAGSMIGEDEDIHLVIEPGRVEEAVRDLVRIGLDRIAGWVDASDLETCTDLIGTPEVDVAGAAAMLDDSTTFVLDVRRATEFAEGHIPAAHNIAHTRLASHLDDVPRDRRIVVNCRSGGRSGRACSLLQRHGYEVVNLAGGMLAWDQAERTAADH